MDAAKILCQNPLVNFLFIGKGRKPKTKHKNIKFLGRLDYKKTLNIISQSFATFVPSQIFEAFPRTAIESLVYSVPVIGTKVGGILEAVGKGGIIVSAGRAEKLAEAGQLLLKDKNLYNKQKEGAKVQARKFCQTEIVKKVLKVYQSLL
ncbi:unnamed protein product [marine sediment metagenome]|uniref:Glycosyl transferase family 1 domain-containing protein n=1 Tax=marine sediment metagenome TaxID=412755 RepID=X1R8I5_9ZZZZ